MKVRWISSVPALVYDPEYKRVVKVVRKVDVLGGEWEEYNDGPSIKIESPAQPKVRPTKSRGTRKK